MSNGRNRGTPYSRRRVTPLQFGVTMVLLASLLLLAMMGLQRYTVGEPILPDWFAKAIHHRQPALPPGMTYDFEIINPATKTPVEVLPEVGTVELRLAVTNDSALPMKVRFPTGNQSEFIVRRVFYYVDGAFALPLEVWRSSYFHSVSPHPTYLVLQPGETKVYGATFTFNALNANQVPAGEYRILAIFDGWETSIPLNKPL
jgi:Intracellular proteinase inhibitor